MSFAYFGYILHETVTNLHCVSVENYMWSMRLWKMSIDQLKKHFCNICVYCFIEWWVKPNIISRSIFWFLSLIFGVFKINFEPTFLQSIFVFTFCCIEYLLIRRVFRRSVVDGIRNLLYDVWWMVL